MVGVIFKTPVHCRQTRGNYVHGKLQVSSAPEPLSQFNKVRECVIEACNGVFAGESLEMNSKDAINVPSSSQVAGQEKLQTFFSSFILR